MKIGIFTDTHGNYLALKAITDYFSACGCEEVVHCGDMISMGPQSRECLDFFFNSKIILVKGNHDMDYVRNITKQRGESHVLQAHKEFVFASIGEDYKLKIAALPLTVNKNYNGLKVMFTHYAKNPDLKFNFIPINQQPDAAFLDESFAYSDADVIFFGHKHEPCDIVGKRHYYDVGSVGCHNEATARGIILEVNQEGSYTVKRVGVGYDRKKTYQLMLEKKIPDAENIFDYYFKESLNK